MSSERYAAALADSTLAPSPPGNSHPECYRVYEALEVGALPVVDTDYFRIVFGVRNLLEVMDPHVWDMALAVTELTLGGTSMSTIVGDRSGRRSNSVPSSRRCVEGEAERITTAKKKRAALNLLRNGCGTEVGVCRVQEAAVGRALIAAVEVLRFRAVQWWERSKARVPRQVAGLIRYTEESRKNKVVGLAKDTAKSIGYFQQQRRQELQEDIGREEGGCEENLRSSRAGASQNAHKNSAVAVSSSLGANDEAEGRNTHLPGGVSSISAVGDAVVLGATSGATLPLVNSLLRHSCCCAGCPHPSDLGLTCPQFDKLSFLCPSLHFTLAPRAIGALRRIHLVGRWSIAQEESFSTIYTVAKDQCWSGRVNVKEQSTSGKSVQLGDLLVGTEKHGNFDAAVQLFDVRAGVADSKSSAGDYPYLVESEGDLGSESGGRLPWKISTVSAPQQTQQSLSIGWLNQTDTLLVLSSDSSQARPKEMAYAAEFDVADRLRFVMGQFSTAASQCGFWDSWPRVPGESKRRMRARQRATTSVRARKAGDQAQEGREAKGEGDREGIPGSPTSDKRGATAVLDAFTYLDYLPVVTAGAGLFTTGGLELVHLHVRPGGELEPDDPDAIRAALVAWWPKLRPGGILTGSNYWQPSPLCAYGAACSTNKGLNALKGWLPGAKGCFFEQHSVLPAMKYVLDQWVNDTVAANASSFERPQSAPSNVIHIAATHSTIVDFAPSWWVQKSR